MHSAYCLTSRREALGALCGVELLLGPQTEPPTSYSLEPTGASSRYLLPFRDAISLIKSLFIRYVWIDTLCVIQSGPGSSEDWHSECSKMQDIYSNCIVGLCLSSRASQRWWIPFQRDVAIRSRNDRDHWRGWVCRMHLYHYPLGLPSRITLRPAARVPSMGSARAGSSPTRPEAELFWDCIRVPNASESLPRISQPDFASP